MKEKILTLLREIQPAYAFEEGCDFITRGYLDSFDLVQLIAALEQEFAISISALELLPENFSSTEAIMALISRSPRRGSANPASIS